MATIIRKRLVNFCELSEEWQAEARSNLDEYAEEALYIEPEDGQAPEKHVLWDLNEAMKQSGEHEGFKYEAVIGISNNSAMLLRLIEDEGDGQEIEYCFV